jgi:hypothetical protein
MRPNFLKIASLHMHNVTSAGRAANQAWHCLTLVEKSNTGRDLDETLTVERANWNFGPPGPLATRLIQEDGFVGLEQGVRVLYPRTNGTKLIRAKTDHRHGATAFAHRIF